MNTVYHVSTYSQVILSARTVQRCQVIADTTQRGPHAGASRLGRGTLAELLVVGDPVETVEQRAGEHNPVGAEPVGDDDPAGPARHAAHGRPFHSGPSGHQPHWP